MTPSRARTAVHEVVEREPRSALALELSRTHARAFLLERVDGRPRLVASGEALATALGPAADAATAARAAIGQVEAAVGRRLFAQGGVLRPRGADGVGVDVASLVVEQPLAARCISCGDRVAAAAGGRVLASLDAPDEPIELKGAADPTALAQTLRAAAPVAGRTLLDALLLVGPFDAELVAKLGRAIEIAAPAGPAEAPVVVWAGEAAGAEAAKAALNGRADVRVAAPLVPRNDLEQLEPARDELVAVWRERLERVLPGAETVARWSADGAMPRRRAEELAVGYLASARHAPIWLARPTAEGADLLQATPGCPRDVRAARCVGGPLPRRARPWSLTGDDRRLSATQALRRAAAGLAAHRRPSANRGPAVVIGSGDLATMRAEDALRALVDALEPRGTVQLALDELEGLSALGGVAHLAPELAAGVLAEELLRPLGALVAPGWRARAGRVAFRFRSAAAGAPAHEPVEIGAEEVRRVKLGDGETADVSVERPAWWDPRRFFERRVRLAVEGGPVGLVLDGRVRPCAGPLSLGREAIEDDAGAPRFLADLAAARPIVAEPSVVRRTRWLPPGARVLVGAGDTVEAAEMIAHLRDGAEATVVPAGKLLGVSDPRPYLVAKPGARVARGDLLASRIVLFGLIRREVRAPVDGILSPHLAGYGNLAIVPAESGDGVAAHVPGTVVGLLGDEGVVVETTAAVISGALGFGPEARGPLLAPAARIDGAEARGGRLRGAVAVLDVLDRPQLDQLRAAGAAGAVVGSVRADLADELVDAPPDLAIVVVEGVGAAPLCARARAALAAHAGQLACLTPGASAGARPQPEVLIPVQSGSPARLSPDAVLAVGASVRLVGPTTCLGRVAGLGGAPARLDEGIWTRVAEVELESGERVTAPLANLELVG